MTDHRVTDLAFGHLGQASYDTEERQWVFSRNDAEKQEIREIQPFKECIPPSIRGAPQDEEIPSVIAKSQMKWLLKAHPETFPGNEIAASLVTSTQEPDFSSDTGPLLVVGKAVDSNRLSGQFTPRIAAMPCGESGTILRLTRLRTQKHAWDRQNGPNLSLLEPDRWDQGYWMGSGGTIRQIAYAEDGNGSSTWFAVRQSSMTTIFRPCFGRAQPTHVPIKLSRMYPSSRLNANPVAALSLPNSGLKDFMDFSFNPWYPRQFAVVDSLGSWSLWDIEGKKNRHSLQKLTAGKSGNVHDGRQPDSTSKHSSPDYIDGWHRILWVCDIGTLVVASRRRIAVFDIKAKPTLLGSIDLSTASSPDWILDIKRSPDIPSHLFVLTATRIFWIAITPAGDGNGIRSGAKILLSWRHKRDPNDKSMRLAVIEDEIVSVLVSSAKNPLMHAYGFSIHTGTTGDPISWESSFTWSNESNLGRESLQTLYFLPAPMSFDSNGEPESPTECGRFFRVFALKSDLALSSALCRAHFDTAQHTSFWTTSPTVKLKQRNRNVRTEKFVDSRFIVPDGVDDYDEQLEQRSIRTSKVSEDSHLRIDWRDIFKHVFPPMDFKDPQSRPQPPLESNTMSELLTGLSARLQEAKDANSLPTSTLLELCRNANISEELDEATSTLLEYFESMMLDDETPSIVISDLTSCPNITLSSGEDTALPNLFVIYDDLAHTWMTNLPPDIPGRTRVSMHKVIRQVAIELCLSSVGLSLQPKDSEQPEVDDGQDGNDEHGAVPSPPLYTPEMTPAVVSEPSVSMSSPPRTPSVYSHATNATGSELGENLAITRLRQHAVAIGSQPDPGKSKLLSSWVVGGNPAEYPWDATQKADDDGEEDDRRRRREDARRKRRTEKFLNRERARAPVAAESQPAPAFLPPGSQPDFAHNGFSSRTVDDMPMTQPDRGAFGSRTATKGKKKKKQKRRKSGF